MQIKRLYGTALRKLLIFPGDWHTLANFQPVLVKIYFHAGLKQLARAAGFKGETLTSLEKCSNFKRTHQFLLQLWQAMYRAMLVAFTTYNEIPEFTLDEDVNIRNVLKISEALLKDSGTEQQLGNYLSSMSKTDDTWRFWYRFVFNDCFAYI